MSEILTFSEEKSGLPIKTEEETSQTPKITEKVEQMAELVCRTYLGRFLPEFKVADTECYLETPASLLAVYEAPLGKTYSAKFLFFDFDPVHVDGGVVKFDTKEKSWVFTCSTGFLEQNYPKIIAAIEAAARAEVARA